MGAGQRSDDSRACEDTERQLRDVELILAETQRLTAVGSWSWDIAMNAVSWSDQLYREFGVSPQEFEPTFASYLASVVHPADQQLFVHTVGAVLHGSAEDFEFDHRIVRRDGQVRWHRARGEAVRDERGHLLRMFGTSQDITASREAEQQLRQQRDELAVLASVVHATEDSVIVTAPDATIVRWNPGAERLYGYTAEEAVGQHLSFVMSGEQAARFPHLLAEMAARGHVRFDSADVHKDGTPLYTSVTVSECGRVGVVSPRWLASLVT